MCLCPEVGVPLSLTRKLNDYIISLIYLDDLQFGTPNLTLGIYLEAYVSTHC